MRIPTLASPAIALAILSCASRAAPIATSPVANCPFQVLVTVSNPRQIAYDVYYQEQGKPATILGEIRPGSTVTFQVPGEGLGYVRLQRPAGDRTPIPYAGRPMPETRIRMHCAGS